MVSLTAEQKTNYAGFPKPGELIEMTGTHALEASDRAILNLLYEHAHDSGRLLEPEAEWEMPLSTLRQAVSKHENNSRLRESLKRLKTIPVTIGYVNEEGEPRLVITGLFDFLDVPAKELASRGPLRYGLPRKLVPVLARSGRWGRIKAEIVCSMTSKYAIALYELIQLRASMHKCVETFPIDRFRELLGVPDDAYARADNFRQRVIDPAVLEVNGLSDMSLQIELERRHSRAPVHAVTLAWWRKSGEEFRAAVAERNRSKLGRMARLRGEVEAGVATASASAAQHDKVTATANAMREAGAPDADIQAFIDGQAAA